MKPNTAKAKRSASKHDCRSADLMLYIIVINHMRGLYVIVINHMRGLYGIYKSRETRAKPEWQGFMNRVQTERWFITIL